MKFVELNTQDIQTRSLVAFMSALGYQLNPMSRKGSFVSPNRGARACRVISFATAQVMHNAAMDDWAVTDTGVAILPKSGVRVGFPVIGVECALAFKLVEKTKLRVLRNGNLLVDSHMVKPLSPRIGALIEAAAAAHAEAQE